MRGGRAVAGVAGRGSGRAGIELPMERVVRENDGPRCVRDLDVIADKKDAVPAG